MYRILIKDKLYHVLYKLQSVLSSQWKNVTPLPLPEVITLTEMSSEAAFSLNLVDKISCKYETARIPLGLRFKMGENGVIQLVGLASRSWDNPTLTLDMAMMHGMYYRGFHLDFAQSNSSGTMPGRVSALCEVVQISICHLQKEMGMKNDPGSKQWNNWILSLPQRYDFLQVQLPNWLSKACLDAVVQEIKESRRLIKLAPSNPEDQEGEEKEEDQGKRRRPKVPNLPQLQVANADGLLENVNCITKGFSNVKLGEIFPGDTVTLGARRKNMKARVDLLDNSMPHITSTLLMPRQVSPPRVQPSAPTQPYPGRQLAENPEWRHHQQGPSSVDWQKYGGIQKQLNDKERFEHLQGNIEQVINTRTNKKKENMYEEILDGPTLTDRPIFHFEVPDKYQDVFERPSSQSVRLATVAGRNNEAKRSDGISSDATTWNNVIKVFERPNSHSINLLNETGRHIEAPKGTALPSNETEWSEESFLGPRFPSLPPGPGDKSTLRVEDKKLVEDLRQITEDELREISMIEGEIHETIYGNRENQPTCSLLNNDRVVAASQCPALLPGNLKDRIGMMHEVLSMMHETKNRHIDTLKQLQHARQNPGHDNGIDAGWNHPDDDDEQGTNRYSRRLANKSRLDYNQINNRGFQY